MVVRRLKNQVVPSLQFEKQGVFQNSFGHMELVMWLNFKIILKPHTCGQFVFCSKMISV